MREDNLGKQEPINSNDAWANSVADAIVGYLKRSQRPHKVMISLNDSEMAMVKKVAKKLKKPYASVVRAASMLGLTAFIQARCKDNK